MPFLLPLMLQVGFGLNPFQSGSVTFVAAIGAMAMKVTAVPTLRWFGFRRVLVFDALLSGMFLTSYGFFTASTPVLLMMGLLLFGGFFRSLEFTAINAITYAEMDSATMSRATSFAAVAQQLSLSLGIAVGAFGIELSQALRGTTHLAVVDFHRAFFLVAIASASSVLFFLSLPEDAGSDLAGPPRHKAAQQG